MTSVLIMISFICHLSPSLSGRGAWWQSWFSISCLQCNCLNWTVCCKMK